MSSLWIPKSADPKHAEAQQYAAHIREMGQRFHETLKHWTAAYRQELNDDRIEIVFMPPTVDPGEGVVPGRYHWVRYNDAPNPPTVEAIQGDSGEFVEPGHWHIERLRGHDLQNPHVLRMQREAREKERAAKERERERDNAERQDHLRDSYNARFRTSISLNRDTPWTQNAAGRRGRKA